MYANSPFLVRRVLAGVLVAAAIVALGLFGWAHIKISQYHDRESRLVAGYASMYQTCESTQGAYGNCASRVDRMCASDGFWNEPQPYSFGLGADLSEASLKCSFGGSSSS